jgi:glyoxalase family protein
VLVEEETSRFGEPALPLRDPHGLALALIETDAERPWVAWEESPVPAEHQLRGMHSVRLWERDLEATARLLTEVLGFEPVGGGRAERGWHRFGVEGGGSGRLVDVKELPRERRGAWGTGGIHHVAWRVEDTPEEMALRGEIEASGLRPTPQIDRFWFRSVYFKEPGGVLFELATAGPGFGRDEDMARLGETLILPPWLEADRAAIEAELPPLRAPATGKEIPP